MKEVDRESRTRERQQRGSASDLAMLHSRWSWCAKLGMTLIVIGIFAISMTALRNIDSVPLLSWLIVLGGLAEAIHAFHLRNSGEFFLHLVPGVAGIPLGLLVATHPAVDIVTWMLVFACFFTVVGLFRLFSALRLRFPGWTWAVFDSCVMLIFGCIFWTTSPRLGLWFFDIAVGISLVLRGWSSIVFGFHLRRTHAPQTHSTTSPAAQTRTHTAVQAFKVKANHIS